MRVFTRTNSVRGLRLLLSCAFLLMADTLSAEDFTVGGITYTTSSDTEVGVSGIDFDVATTDVQIPATVLYDGKTYTVTAVKGGVFDGKEVVSVVFPNTITTLPSRLFYKCNNLTSVTLPDNLTEIPDEMFEQTGLTKVDVPESVTTIGHNAFSTCGSLTSVSLPSGLDSIAYYAFSLCGSLSEITLPESLRSIGGGAFIDCTSLSKINIPALENVGSMIFAGCTSLNDVRISEGCRVIGGGMFVNCSALRSLTLPESVTTIGGGAFEGCTSMMTLSFGKGLQHIEPGVFEYRCALRDVYYDGTIADWCKIFFESYPLFNSGSLLYEERNLYVRESETSDDFTLLTDLVVPEGVDSIPAYAFYGYSKLKSVVVPSTVDRIGTKAFCCCVNLAEVDVDVRYVDSDAFYSSPNVRKLTIGARLEEMGNRAFCIANVKGKMTVIYYEGSLDNWFRIKRNAESIDSAYKFYADGSPVTDVVVPDDIKEIPSYIFYGISSIKNLTIPQDTKVIGAYAFYSCDNLQSVNFKPAEVSSCKLSKIVAEDEGLCIGSYAFEYCSKLSEINLPDKVSLVENRAFAGTPWEENLPDGLNYIGKTAYCYKGVMPENSAVEIKDGTIHIGDFLFRDMTGLSSITIPSTVVSIGNGAFFGCIGLSTITIPGSVVCIGWSAFSGCTGLSSITISEGVTSIGSSAFYSCTGLSSMTIPGSVTYIGGSAFSKTTNLKTFVLAHGMDELVLEYSTFMDISIEDLYIERDVKDVYFAQNSDVTLRNITIGAAVNEIEMFCYNAKFEAVTVHAVTPPVCGDMTFGLTDKQACLLRIPKGTRAAYAEADVWKDFLNVEEFDVTAVEAPTVSVSTEGVHYDLSGRQVSPSAKGLHIIRMSDGSSRKVLVK